MARPDAMALPSACWASTDRPPVNAAAASDTDAKASTIRTPPVRPTAQQRPASTSASSASPRTEHSQARW